jgi:hypothetical protein
MAVADSRILRRSGVYGRETYAEYRAGRGIPGRHGVVVNAPTPNETIEAQRTYRYSRRRYRCVEHTISKPAGSGNGYINFWRPNTARSSQIKAPIRMSPSSRRRHYGGRIALTIEGGANAITYTPPAQASCCGYYGKYRSQWDDRGFRILYGTRRQPECVIRVKDPWNYNAAH